MTDGPGFLLRLLFCAVLNLTRYPLRSRLLFPRCATTANANSYDNHGFQLTDGVDVRGSMICLPNSYVLWEPKRSADITVESLLLIELVIPKIGANGVLYIAYLECGN